MNGDEIIYVTNAAIYVCILIILPICISAMVIGLIVSIFQSVTQIQEMTLTFVPKMLVMLLVLLITIPYMSNQMAWLMDIIVDRMVKINGIHAAVERSTDTDTESSIWKS